MIIPAAFVASLPAKARAVHAWVDSRQVTPQALDAFFGAGDGYPAVDLNGLTLDPETAADDVLRDVDFGALMKVVPWSRRVPLPSMFASDAFGSPSTSVLTLLYAFEVAARSVPVDFETHIAIFPDRLWAPLLCVAYSHGHAPMFGLRAPCIQDSWYAAAIAYADAVGRGRVRPDFDLIASMPTGNYRLVDDLAVEHEPVSATSDELVRRMLRAAYSWVDPAESHLTMFPRQHLTIKGVARARARTRAILRAAVGVADIADTVMRRCIPAGNYMMLSTGPYVTWVDYDWSEAAQRSPIVDDGFVRSVYPMFKMAAMAARIQRL